MFMSLFGPIWAILLVSGPGLSGPIWAYLLAIIGNPWQSLAMYYIFLLLHILYHIKIRGGRAVAQLRKGIWLKLGRADNNDDNNIEVDSIQASPGW